MLFQFTVVCPDLFLNRNTFISHAILCLIAYMIFFFFKKGASNQNGKSITRQDRSVIPGRTLYLVPIPAAQNNNSPKSIRDVQIPEPKMSSIAQDMMWSLGQEWRTLKDRNAWDKNVKIWGWVHAHNLSCVNKQLNLCQGAACLVFWRRHVSQKELHKYLWKWSRKYFPRVGHCSALHQVSRSWGLFCQSSPGTESLPSCLQKSVLTQEEAALR